MFGVTRLPGLPTDSLVHAPHPHPTNYVVVSAKDHVYKLSVLNKDASEQVSLETIEADLWSIAEDAAFRPTGEGVGALSGDARDTWTAAREHLLALDPKNRASVTAIEDSLFAVSIDDFTVESDEYVTSSPETRTPDLDAHIRYGSSSAGTGRNRWWDKGVSIAFENNGRGTMIGEHSPCDALIPSIVADYALAEGVTEGPSMKGKGSTSIERLEWVLDDKARSDIDKAVATIGELAQDSDGKMLWYDEYGVEWIKKTGMLAQDTVHCDLKLIKGLDHYSAKQSPDAYLQMALQLAFHKDQGAPVATYETASTRLFKHGRTDVIRTLSEDSWRWVQAMREGKEEVSSDSQSAIDILLISSSAAHKTVRHAYGRDKGSQRVHSRLVNGQRLRPPLYGPQAHAAAGRIARSV